MAYLTAFLEGIISFISPCILPLLPLYISYLAGGLEDREGRLRILVVNSLAFIAGFSLLFVLMGAASTAIGTFLQRHLALLNRIGGVVLILFSLNTLGLIALPLLNTTKRLQMRLPKVMNLPKSLLFGCIFAIGWTPCVGPLLGSALMLASNAEHVGKGMITLLFFSLGLGIPFFLSALLLGQLEGVFTLFKRHAKLVSLISGGLLLVFGLALVLGFNPAVLFL